MCEFQALTDCLSVHLLLQKYFPGQSAGPGGKQDTEQNLPSTSEVLPDKPKLKQSLQ